MVYCFVLLLCHSFTLCSTHLYSVGIRLLRSSVSVYNYVRLYWLKLNFRRLLEIGYAEKLLSS